MSALEIPDAELEVLKALNRADVVYLLIGGYAMRWYGATRQTIDVDLLTSPRPDNARRFIRAVETVLGHSPGFSDEMFAQPRKQVSFRGDGYQLSVLTSVDGLAFEAAYREREHAPQGRVVIPIVSRGHLALIKRVAANSDPSRRTKEMSDIALLEAASTA
jgi:hypothetical protein